MEVASGEAVALLGASGSGKSTLLNIISGLIVPDSGSVRVDSVELSTLSAEARTLFRRERIGFVFQFFHLIPTLTVMENLRLPLQPNGKLFTCALAMWGIAIISVSVGLVVG